MKKNNQKTYPEPIKGYVIGVDGGGTTTTAALADLKGKILNIGESGYSSPRNVGIEMTAANIAKGIGKVLPKDKKIKILSTFTGLPAVEEEFKSKKDKIKKELLKYKEVSPIFQGKIIIGSDQIVAFCSGTEKKDGVLLIAGTGGVVHGWKGKKEAKASGWGWLADEGSAFWTGQKVIQAILKNIDGRGKKTLLTKLVFQKLKVKTIEELLFKVYSKNFKKTIPSFSIFCDTASKGGDEIAKEIMLEAGKELALAGKTIIRKLNFQKIEFPLVLVGGMFKSKIPLETVKKEIKKIAPKAEFIQPKEEPIVGAIKLAIEQVKKNNENFKNKSKKL